jgi:hypothetical protein
VEKLSSVNKKEEPIKYLKKERTDQDELTRLNKRVQDLDRQRQPLMLAWEQISNYITPGRGIYNKQEPNQGERRDQFLLDNTPLQALGILSAGMQGGLTSPSRPWFRLGVSDPWLSDDQEVRLWLDEVERRMIHVMGQSNSYNSLHMLYSEIASFGTGCMLVEADEEAVIRCYTMTAGEYYITYTAAGLPEVFARVFWMTAEQLYEQFGIENMSETSRTALMGNNPDMWIRVCHMIMPNKDYERNKPIQSRKRYLSVYWEEGQHEKFLKRGGYDQFPIMAPRWEVLGSDFYGRGPGWDALGESKTLQEMRRDYLIAQKMGIHPPLVGPTALKKARANLLPGSITYVDSEPQTFRTLYEVRPDIPGQIQAMQDSRDMIRSTFFADLFLTIIASQDRDMTARQVEEMHVEKMMMIGPVLERLENELLDPLIGRCFALMDDRGLIPPAPEVLAGKMLKIDYISLLAQAQQAVGLSSVDKLTAFVAGLSQFNPEVLDKFDGDEAIDQYARMLGVPAAVIKSDEMVAEVRMARAQQQAMQEQLAAAQSMAQTAASGGQALASGAQGMQSMAETSAMGGAIPGESGDIISDLGLEDVE